MQITISLDYWQACHFLAPLGYVIKSETRTAHIGNHGGVEEMKYQEMIATRRDVSVPLEVAIRHEVEEMVNKHIQQ
jgi:hypothetical protein